MKIGSAADVDAQFGKIQDGRLLLYAKVAAHMRPLPFENRTSFTPLCAGDKRIEALVDKSPVIDCNLQTMVLQELGLKNINFHRIIHNILTEFHLNPRMELLHTSGILDLFEFQNVAVSGSPATFRSKLADSYATGGHGII